MLVIFFKTINLSVKFQSIRIENVFEITENVFDFN